MYDYRNDIKELLDATKPNEESLDQTMVALGIIGRMYDALVKKKPTDPIPEKIVGIVDENQDNSEISDDNDSESTSEDNEEKVGQDSHKGSEILSKVVLANKAKFANTQNILLPKPKVAKVEETEHVEVNTSKYKIKRKLLGAEVLDDDGNSIQYFNESSTRNMQIVDGDEIVLTQEVDSKGRSKIVKVGQVYHNNEKDDSIVEFEPAIVEKDGFGLFVEKDINGERLSKVNREKARLYIDFSSVSHFNIHEKDILAIAWEKDTPGDIRVRWKYSIQPKPIEKKKSNPKSRYKKLLHKRKNSETSAAAEKQSEEYIPRIKFELDNKRVAIIVGDKSITSNLKKVVVAHNGTAKIVDIKQPANALRAVKESDYVILIQNYIKHGISKLIINRSKRDYSVAMAPTTGQLAVEKALYRAKYKLNVTEAPQDIDYPYYDPDSAI